MSDIPEKDAKTVANVLGMLGHRIWGWMKAPFGWIIHSIQNGVPKITTISQEEGEEEPHVETHTLHSAEKISKEAAFGDNTDENAQERTGRPSIQIG